MVFTRHKELIYFGVVYKDGMTAFLAVQESAVLKYDNEQIEVYLAGVMAQAMRYNPMLRHFNQWIPLAGALPDGFSDRYTTIVL